MATRDFVNLYWEEPSLILDYFGSPQDDAAVELIGCPSSFAGVV